MSGFQNDQVSQPGTDKFSDDHAHRKKPDVDLHHTQDKRNGVEGDDLQKLFLCVPPRVSISFSFSGSARRSLSTD